MIVIATIILVVTVKKQKTKGKKKKSDKNGNAYGGLFLFRNGGGDFRVGAFFACDKEYDNRRNERQHFGGGRCEPKPRDFPKMCEKISKRNNQHDSAQKGNDLRTYAFIGRRKV